MFKKYNLELLIIKFIRKFLFYFIFKKKREIDYFIPNLLIQN